MTSLPPTLRYYVIPAGILTDTAALLQEPAERQIEAVVVWLGQVVDPLTARVTTAYRPSQIAYISDMGLAVEVPPDSLAELISNLPSGVFVLVRLHTHPGTAYHSDTDDTNMLISHQGAISIVIPDFGRGLFDLAACSVNELRHGQGWVELTPEEVTERFTVR